MGLSATAYIEQLKQLLPPGRLWTLESATWLYKTLRAIADELARVDGRAEDLIEESDPTTATETLDEWESVYGLTSDSSATDGERRAALLTAVNLRQRFRAADIQQALAALLALDPADVEIILHSRAFAIAVGDDTEIYKFFVYRDPALSGTENWQAAQAVLDQIKPAHTEGYVIQSVDFLCEDEFSLCDRDILGA